jgi:hypothetical protein
MDNWRPSRIQCYYGYCWCRLGMYSLITSVSIKDRFIVGPWLRWRYQTYNRGLSYSWPWSWSSFRLRYWTISIAGRRAWRKGTDPRPCLLRASGFGQFMWGCRTMSYVKRSKLTAEWSERWSKQANEGSYGCVFGIAQLDVIYLNHHLSRLVRNLVIVW